LYKIFRCAQEIVLHCVQNDKGAFFNLPNTTGVVTNKHRMHNVIAEKPADVQGFLYITKELVLLVTTPTKAKKIGIMQKLTRGFMVLLMIAKKGVFYL